MTGKDCQSCKDARINDDKAPRKLQMLSTATIKGRPVYACEWCDGPVVELAAKTAQKKQ